MPKTWADQWLPSIAEHWSAHVLGAPAHDGGNGGGAGGPVVLLVVVVLMDAGGVDGGGAGASLELQSA